MPEHVTLLARFSGEVTPVKSTVTKAVAEFRRTHADTWNLQKDSFTEEQLEVILVKELSFHCFIFLGNLQLLKLEKSVVILFYVLINACRFWLIHPRHRHILLDIYM